MELSVVGILIRYYRKKKQITVLSFLQPLPNEKPICSTKTLSSIERGKIHKLEIVESLCMKLGKTLLLNQQVQLFFDCFKLKLIKSLIEMSVSKMRQLSIELSKLTISEHHIYFYELSCLYQDILNYYLYNKIPLKDDVDIFQEIKEHVDEDHRKLILFFLYQLSNINTMNINRDEIIIQCKPYLDDPLFFTRMLIDIYDNNSKLNTYGRYWNIQCSQSLNHFQRVYLKHMMSFCLMNSGDQHDSYMSLKAELEKDENHDFSDSYKTMLYIGFSISAYSLNEYDKVIEYLLKTMKINKIAINYNYLILFDSLEKTNRIDEIISITKNLDLSRFQNDLVKQIINYYKIKHQIYPNIPKKYSLLEKILYEDLIQLVNFGSIYKNILQHELNYLISITRNYRKLHVFIDE